MPSQVYFADLRAGLKRNLIQKIDNLIGRVGLAERISPGDITAIKLHFGEKGNTSYIRPVFVARFVEAVKKAGGKPFLTDCNTLYVGSRGESVSHLTTATTNGFAYSVVGAPLIIADGVKGTMAVPVKLGLADCEEAFIGAEIVNADALVSLAHFKGHEVAGFGGTIKNLGMGAASRHGKLFQHSDITPSIAVANCVACGQCLARCRPKAIRLRKRTADEPAPASSEKPGFVATKDPERCIGCGDCILACRHEAIQIEWNAQLPVFFRRMAAYTKAVLTGKEDKSVCFNFITQVSPACDCYPFTDAPIVGDVGIVASTDPVAIDQASVDLVNRAPGLAGSELKHAHEPGGDKFRALYPRVDWTMQLDRAADLGVGGREYELVMV